MAKNRLKTLTELRRVRVDNQIWLVHRCGKYESCLCLDYIYIIILKFTQLAFLFKVIVFYLGLSLSHCFG
jgi:hypothetical protein